MSGIFEADWEGTCCPFQGCDGAEKDIETESLLSFTGGLMGFRVYCGKCLRSWRMVLEPQFAEAFVDGEGEELPGAVVVDGSLLERSLRVLGSWERGDLAEAVNGLRYGCENLLGELEAEELVALLADEGDDVPLVVAGVVEDDDGAE